ncbi:hypothetical protein LQV05_001233 [Cryptococcus neoformans]|nr:hypothetical protein LQV05_001233 [Cryptococcus neoformans]
MPPLSSQRRPPFRYALLPDERANGANVTWRRDLFIRLTGTRFNVKEFFKPLKDPRVYTFASIGRFRYSTVKTNLFNVAPYVVGTICLLITSWSSNWFRERGFHLASSFVLVLIGCIILIALPVSQMGARYFATFLITAGAFTPPVLFHTWHQCNDASEDGRAFRVGSYTFLANTGGIVSTKIFLHKWAPANHWLSPSV